MSGAGRIGEIVAYRELLWMLVWRDVRVRYKHSVLGAAWAVAPPLLTMAVFVLVFQRELGIGAETLTGQSRVPYALFVFSGLAPWGLFAAGLSGGAASLVANRPLLTKIAFPREVFPLAAVGAALVDFLVAWAVLAGLAAWYAARGTWTFEPGWALALLPAVMAVQVSLTAGLAMLLAMGNLFYRDVGFVLRALLPVWMFLTNVVYEVPAGASALGVVIRLNPMTPIIGAYRYCLFGGAAPSTGALGYAACAAAVALGGAWWWFHRREAEFAERA